MSDVTRPGRRVAFALALVLLLVARRVGTASSQSSPPPAQATCVFTNPAYSGKCTETAPVASGGTALQACQSILQCLNDVGCLKTYCQATTVRSGWKLESAK